VGAKLGRPDGVGGRNAQMRAVPKMRGQRANRFLPKFKLHTFRPAKFPQSVCNLTV